MQWNVLPFPCQYDDVNRLFLVFLILGCTRGKRIHDRGVFPLHEIVDLYCVEKQIR